MAILVAYDGSDPARQALEHAVTMYPDEEIVLLRVVEAAGGSTSAGVSLAKEKLRELREDAAATSRSDAEEILDVTDVDFRIETTAGDPARAIVAFAEEGDVEHIVVGNHGRTGVSRVLLGSVAEAVARRAPVPVTVVR